MMKRNLGLMFALGLVGGCMVNGKPLFGLGSVGGGNAPVPGPTSARVAPFDPAAAMPTSVPAPKSYAWCNDVAKETEYRLVERAVDDNASPSNAIPSIMQASCFPEDGAPRDRVEASRQKWMRRLLMTEADWARDAVAWNAKGDAYRSEGTWENEIILKQEDAMKMSTRPPIAQWAMISDGHVSDKMPLADELPPTALGNAAWVARCLESKDAERWAVCQPDIDALDEGKLAAELRADTEFDGWSHMAIRLSYAKMVRAKLPEHAAAVKALLAKDPAYAKIFAVAKSARTAWLAAEKDHPEFMALVGASEDAQDSTSRKVHEELDAKLKGCSGKGEALFTELLAKTSVSTFSQNTTHVFPQLRKERLLVANPSLYMAAKQMSLCTDDKNDPIRKAVGLNFEIRGPRAAAEKALELADIKLDDMSNDEQESTPTLDDKKLEEAEEKTPAIAAVKDKGTTVVVSFVQQPKYWDDQCTKETEKVVGLKDNGDYKTVMECTESKKILIDPTPAPVTIPKKYAAGIAPGRFIGSGIHYEHGEISPVWDKKHAMPIAEFGVLLKP